MSTAQAVPRKDITVGQKIWAKILIDPKALVKPTGTLSHTMRKIFNGIPVRKQCYVLQVTPTHLEVAHTTTFGHGTSLSSHVANPDAWYPIAPTPANLFTPLPTPVNQAPEFAVACWVYLHQTHFVTEDSVVIFADADIPQESVDKIVAAMPKKKGDSPESSSEPPASSSNEPAQM
ncbi:hypothetical protein FRC08_007697 [Ceratobasidium sp. 394]|nr:hypothetical protein FRC08_007697 [Ceratobasidium sp. 394]